MNRLKGESHPGCEVCEILTDTPDGFPTLYVGNHWIASLRNADQTLLGTSFITARRHVHELDDLNIDEEFELIVIRNALIKVIRREFQPITFNFSCLKNYGVQGDGATEADPHTHWHLKPRYKQPVTVNGEEFVDPMPGRYLTEFPRHRPNPETAREIFAVIYDGMN